MRTVGISRILTENVLIGDDGEVETQSSRTVETQTQSLGTVETQTQSVKVILILTHRYGRWLGICGELQAWGQANADDIAEYDGANTWDTHFLWRSYVNSGN